MRPVLALELSVDGILLHELSYDGKWRQIAAAGLSDPLLPKKMKAMRATAKASQGQWFKNEVWIPREQMYSFEMGPVEDDADPESEAQDALQKNPAIPDGNYVVRLADEDGQGNVKVVAIEKSVLDETRRFASGYGFGADGITIPGKVPGFYNQPYFDIVVAQTPKVSVNFRKIGFFAGLTTTAAGILAGGYWLYSTIEFTPDPATVLEASANRVFSDEEDPRAPIRPTSVTQVTAPGAPITLETSADNAGLPARDAATDLFEAHVEGTSMASTLDVEASPERGSPLAAIAFWQEAPTRASEGRPDSLPAPESSGFAVVSTNLADPDFVTADSNIAMGTALATFVTKRPENDFIMTTLGIDPLPSNDSTVVLAALARKLDDNFGLTQVRANDAAAVRGERAADLQNVAAVVIEGLPDFLPILRSGADVNEIIEPVIVAVAPEVTPLTINELQNLAAIVEGPPSFLPILRGGIEIGAEPVEVEPVVVEPVAPEVEVVETAPELSLEELQNLAAVVVEGAPSTVPTLRGGIEIGAEPVIEEPVLAENVEPLVEAPQPQLSIEELQNLAAVVVTGQPSTLPTLRDGVEIGAEPVVEDPVIPEVEEPEVAEVEEPQESELSLEELQNLAAVVVEGSPSTVPTLRAGVEIGAEPVVEEPVIAETVVDEEPVDPAVEIARIEELQNAPANVIEGLPSTLPLLRPDTDIGAGVDVDFEEPTPAELAEAARNRPIFRPDSIVEIAVVNDPDLSEAAVTNSAAPEFRSPEFGARVALMMETFAETERTTPRFTEEPREVSLPTSANVAAEATIENGINLNATSLIGVYGKPGTYRALIRQSGGIYSMVTIGQSVGGWQIVGIDESTVRIQRGSRTEILRLPG